MGMIDIVEELIKKSNEKNITLKELSRKSGISYRTIMSWCEGNANPTFYNIQCVFEALGMEICIRKKQEGNEENL